MKKLISVLLLLALLLALCACGEDGSAQTQPDKPEEATQDSDRIGDAQESITALNMANAPTEDSAIGFGSYYETWYLERAESIEAAEAACAALSEEELALVENYPELIAAREGLEHARILQARAQNLDRLAGQWANPLSNLGYEAGAELEGIKLEIPPALIVNPEAVVWAEDGVTVAGLGDMRVCELDGIPMLVSKGSSMDFIYVRTEDLPEFLSKHVTSAEITPENVGEYLGDPVIIGKALDSQGKVEEDTNIFLFPSLVYEQGLVYLDNKGFDLHLMDQGGSIHAPYESFRRTRSEVAMDSVKGTLYFLHAEDVAEVRIVTKENGYAYRYVTLTNGASLMTEFWYIQTDADLNDWPF